MSRSRRPMKPAQWRKSKGWTCTCFWCTSPQFNGLDSMPVRRATVEPVAALAGEETRGEILAEVERSIRERDGW